MKDDGKFAELLRETVRAMEPPPVPREAMWQRIQHARRAGEAPPLVQRPGREWTRWALPLAATLVLGIALGRLTVDRSVAPQAFVEAPPVANPSATVEPALPYVLAAVQHLARTQDLLASLQSGTRATGGGDVSGWASDLLSNTRLLIDSPAAADPQMAALLRDLELILAQIAALPAAPPATELQLIEDGMARSNVMDRLRAATHERPIFGT